MTPDERLTEVFDRGVNHGETTLSPADRELFLIQSFILDYGYRRSYRLPFQHAAGLGLYRCDDPGDVRSGPVGSGGVISGSRGAIPRFFLCGPANHVVRGARADDPTDWVDELHHRIGAVENYGLDASSIA